MNGPLLVWVVFRCPGVVVRCLVRPALAGSPRDGLVHRPSIVSAVSRVASPLWEDDRRTEQEEVDGLLLICYLSYGDSR